MTAPDHDPLYRLEKLCRDYGAHRALGPLDLAIHEGERVALIGPSGCGKSTLMRLLAGLVAPSGGQILFRGQLLGAHDIRAYRRHFGYVIQSGGLFPHLTASQNVVLMARQAGWSRQKIAARLDELAQLVHLEPDQLARYPVELSGGQRQRVSLMRALMLGPDVMALDEPLGALDPMIRFQLQADLRGIFETVGATVILVTHDLAEAAWLADRIILLRDGLVVQDGSFDDLCHHPAEPFVSEFVRAQRGLMIGGAE
ncbi:glycine betaine/carnitine/choline transport ATP-binding protein OpuCA [alpha proteobacterium Q-1]|nr:glycine betaine/carnitine/choline transport ATP-binding protein OpuCA [alpha proteobacterium Q-1]